MKPKPQILTSPAIAAVVAVFAAVLLFSHPAALTAATLPFQESADSAADESTGETDAATAKAKRSDQSAAEVFRQVSARLDDLDAISCDLRQSIVMSGLRFVAVGKYAQASGNRMRLKYQIKPVSALKRDDTNPIPTGDSEASDEESTDDEDKKKSDVTGELVQVSDGSVLWSHWKNGDFNEVTRRNITEILEAVADVPNYSAADSLQDLGVGGLQTLMSRLQAGMDFGAVLEQTIGGRSMYILSGRWNQDTLKEGFQLEDPETQRLPDYVPDYVRIYVDAEQKLPRRIQYLKKHPDPQVNEVRPLVTLDISNLKLSPNLDDSVFRIPTLDDEELTEVDLTSNVIDSIKRMAKARDEATSEDQSGDDSTEPDAPK